MQLMTIISICFSCSLHAIDWGVCGEVFPIIETDYRQLLQKSADRCAPSKFEPN